MPISRVSTKLSDKRTQNYNTVLQSVVSGVATPAADELGTGGANLLVFTSNLPQSVSAVAGNAFVFSVAVSAVNSSAALTYQWQTSTDGVTWTNISATESKYTRTFSSGDNNLRLRVLVTQLLRTIISGTCQISIVAAASSVFGADDSATGQLATVYLSNLALDPPQDPMAVSKTYLSSMVMSALCVDPTDSLGIPYVNIWLSKLDALLSDPV